MDGLPLAPDYDHLPIGVLQHLLRGLDADRLRELRDYEVEHAARHGVLRLIDSRLQQLADGAEPSPGGEQPGIAPTAPSPRTPQAGPSTAAEPTTPHRHGRVEQSPRRARP